MRRLISLICISAMALCIIALAIANRAAVTFSLDPFSTEAPGLAFEMPLFLVFFGGVGLGILVGGFAAWVGQGATRRLARQRGRALLSQAQPAPAMPHKAEQNGAPSLH